MEALVHGFILSLGLILPLGVQNVFIFNQGARQASFYQVLPVVITAALCDTLLILLAVMGVSVVVLSFTWIKTIFLGIGLVFLSLMGWNTWRSRSGARGSESDEIFTPKKQILFAISVSLLNPHAIMDTVGVIGTSSLGYSGVQKIWFTVACIFVSWLWFISLAFAGRMIGSLDQTGFLMIALNKVSALVMWGAALYIGWMFIH